MPNVPKDVIDLLKSREGFKDVVYLDSLGLPTVGMGHLLTDAEKKQYKVGDKPPSATLEAWAQAETAKAYDAALAQAATLKGTTQNFINALASVNFQLGTEWNTKMKKTWAFMQSGEWEKAAVESQDSGWFKQTPVRVKDFQTALRALTVAKPFVAPKPAPAPAPAAATPAPPKASAPVLTPAPTPRTLVITEIAITSGTYVFKIGAVVGQGVIKGDSVNVRKGPGTEYDKTGAVLKNGAVVKFYGEARGWRCIGDGQWVSGDFVSVAKASGR